MPTNLPPEYAKIEQRHRAASSIREKIETLQEMISVVPKHKGTDKLRADLRRKLSKLKSEAQSKKGTSKQESAYHIDKEGAGQVILVGAANVGKSALVASLTNATPEVSEYAFTTWAPTPGMMKFENIQIQLVDTPPINEEYVEPDMLDLIRRSDLVLLMVDMQAYPLQQLEDTVQILEQNRIVAEHRADLHAGEQRITLKPILVLANKCDDQECDEELAVLKELLEGEWTFIPISVTTGRYVEQFKQVIFEQLEVVRVYSKPPGQEANYNAPFVMPKGGTVADFAGKVHLDFYEKLKTARVWGSAVHDGLMVGRNHVLQDGDVVELRI